MPKTFRTRSTGDDVMFLQELLNLRPPPTLPLLALDAKCASKTLVRVQEIQGNNALTVDGIVGVPTWAKLLRHAVVKTTGFCVLGRDLYDRLGAGVILRGVNKMSVFEQPDDSRGQISFPEIKQTGANSVRIVWAIATDQGATSTASLGALIANAKANHRNYRTAAHALRAQPWMKTAGLGRHALGAAQRPARAVRAIFRLDAHAFGPFGHHQKKPAGASGPRLRQSAVLRLEL